MIYQKLRVAFWYNAHFEVTISTEEKNSDASSEAHSKHQNLEVNMRTWLHICKNLSQIQYSTKTSSVMENIALTVYRVIHLQVNYCRLLSNRIYLS